MYLIFFILHGSNKPKNNLNIDLRSTKNYQGLKGTELHFVLYINVVFFFFIIYIISISDIAHISIEYLISALL